jgi:hypothetical protein
MSIESKFAELASVSTAELEAADISFVIRNWESDFLTDRIERRVQAWFKSHAAELTGPQQVMYLQASDKSLKYIPDLGRAGQRFVLENLEESDLSTMIGKAHGYSVIVPDLWDAIISQLEAGTLSRRELAAYEARERLPRAFKIALGAHNLGSTHMAGDGGAARGRRRSAESDVEAKRPSRSAKVEPAASPLNDFLEATRSEARQLAAKALLKNARAQGIKLSSADRVALREVVAAEGSSEIRAAYKLAAKALVADETAVVAEEAKPSRRSKKPEPVVEKHGMRSRRVVAKVDPKLEAAAEKVRSSRRKTVKNSDSDFSNAANAETAVRRVRRPSL